MNALVQQPHPVVTSPVIPPMSEPRNRFLYGMMNFKYGVLSRKYAARFNCTSAGNVVYQQMNNPNFP